MTAPMKPTPGEVAAELERALAAPEPAAWVTTKHYEIGLIVKANRDLIVRALRALGEPDEAAVERAAEAAYIFSPLRSVPWPDVTADVRTHWIGVARAALRSRAADE
jgi:hypothetical protein